MVSTSAVKIGPMMFGMARIPATTTTPPASPRHDDQHPRQRIAAGWTGLVIELSLGHRRGKSECGGPRVIDNVVKVRVAEPGTVLDQRERDALRGAVSVSRSRSPVQRWHPDEMGQFMGSVIGELLPLAIGIAVSPMPIIAAILMLLSKRAGSTSIGFLIGWVLGIIVATGIFTALAGTPADRRRAVRRRHRGSRSCLGLLLFSVGRAAVAGRKGTARPAQMDGGHRRFHLRQVARAGLPAVRHQPEEPDHGGRRGVIIGSAGLSVGSEIGSDRGVHRHRRPRRSPSR